MSEFMRCTNCYGQKQVPKLGGMIGDCNLCSGTGKISCEPVVSPVPLESVDITPDFADAVADCVPVTIIDAPVADKVKAKEFVAKGTRKVFKRKTA